MLFTPATETTLTAKGGSESANPALLDNLRKEETSLNKKLKNLRFYPVA